MDDEHLTDEDRAKLIASSLMYANVPYAACQFIKDHFRGNPLSAFNVVSHLLAATARNRGKSGTHYVPAPAFTAMGVTRRDKKLLFEAGIIEKVDDHIYTEDKAATYRLGSPLMQALLASDDPRTYQFWGNFPRKRFKPQPNPDLHPSFEGIHLRERQPILDLQQRPIAFDRIGALRWLADSPDNLTTEQLDFLRVVVMTLNAGDNYASYRLARSGRVQACGPTNFQNLSKHLRRWCYPEAGYKFIDIDFRAQEPRILAFLAEDWDLLADLNAAAPDFYTQLCLRFGWMDADRRPDRDLAKQVLNAFNYDSNDWGLARIIFNTDKPRSDQVAHAHRFREYMDDTFPISRDWKKARIAEIKKTGVAVTAGGFKREGIKPKDAGSIGLNHLVQGTAADLLRFILLRVTDELPPAVARILVPAHDGWTLAGGLDRVDQVIATIEGLMAEVTDAFLPGLYIPPKVTNGWRHPDHPEAESNIRPANPGDRGRGRPPGR